PAQPFEYLGEGRLLALAQRAERIARTGRGEPAREIDLENQRRLGTALAGQQVLDGGGNAAHAHDATGRVAEGPAKGTFHPDVPRPAGGTTSRIGRHRRGLTGWGHAGGEYSFAARSSSRPLGPVAERSGVAGRHG